MTLIQLSAGWGVAYIVTPLVVGLFAEAEACEFWSGFRNGLIAVFIINVIVGLVFIANGWTPWIQP